MILADDPLGMKGNDKVAQLQGAGFDVHPCVGQRLTEIQHELEHLFDSNPNDQWDVLVLDIQFPGGMFVGIRAV